MRAQMFSIFSHMSNFAHKHFFDSKILDVYFYISVMSLLLEKNID